MLWRIGFFLLILAAEKLHHAELTVGKRKKDDFPLRRQKILDPLDVYFCVFPARAMAGIDGILEHGKAVLQKLLSEKRCILSVLFCFGREVVIHKYPHDAISVEA